MSETGLKVYTLLLLIRPLFWAPFPQSASSMDRGRFRGSFQAHSPWFPHQTHLGCLCISSKEDPHMGGSLGQTTGEDHWLSWVTCSSCKHIGALNCLVTSIRTKSWGRNVSQITGDSCSMKGGVLSRDTVTMPLWLSSPSLWGWIWEMIKISVKVIMNKLVIKF